MNRETVFSPCRQYRYTLWRKVPVTFSFEPRKWTGFVQFIGLNPSTADETTNDPTVRRCIDYASRWGFGSMCMTNLFALRATDPKVMLAHPVPIGILNIHWLTEIAKEAGLIICAWGVHGQHIGQAETVLEHLDRAGLRSKLHRLKKTKDGIPGHPLYLRRDLQPTPLFDAIEGINEA